MAAYGEEKERRKMEEWPKEEAACSQGGREWRPPMVEKKKGGGQRGGRHKQETSPDGDIIDSVRISHQPAFPLLKNVPHCPESSDESKFPPIDENEECSSIPQLWHQNGRCPVDTIPIRRNKKDDVLKHAIVYVQGGFYYGAKATMNMWNPKLESPDAFSLSQLWIIGGPDQLLDTIEAGWFIQTCMEIIKQDYWTQDGYQSTGCCNLKCPGFIQVYKKIALGAAIDPISSYGGKQYDITLYVWKDPKTGNWWLHYGNLSPLGYWPSSLLPYLTYGGPQRGRGYREHKVKWSAHLDKDGQWPFPRRRFWQGELLQEHSNS
ncbi:protein neprosin-like [Elaeis guineensis]|uniref:protein neprosin-like n=1 Tax=Elaeis guineensis var. tenera TaxID=51953 RepID=UPI003C6D7E9A